MIVNEIRNPVGTTAAFAHSAIDAVSSLKLREVVETLAYPRHYVAQRDSNARACQWIADELSQLGFDVHLQGAFDNVIALPKSYAPGEKLTLLSAHYDTVETTPGADDNNSAIAVCLEAARVLAHLSLPLGIAVFNREEDGLLGSADFVQNGLSDLSINIAEVHNFEMVGYFVDHPNSQHLPAGLPIKLPDVGDFLGLVSNQKSNSIGTRLEESARAIGLRTPVATLKTYLGIEKLVSDLLRSDHASFWQAGIPALMWTDTSNFRNPHYHAATDLPDTLNYEAMADVTRLIVAHILRGSEL